MRLIAKTFIRLYQYILSPLLGRNCRYIPSCSSYGLEAVNRHGSMKGTLLTIGRILSCHPFSKRSLHDPVPQVFTWRSCLGYKATTTTTMKNHEE